MSIVRFVRSALSELIDWHTAIIKGLLLVDVAYSPLDGSGYLPVGEACGGLRI